MWVGIALFCGICFVAAVVLLTVLSTRDRSNVN